MNGEIATVGGGEIVPLRPLADEDLAALRRAVHTLERSTLVGRLSAMAGRPLEILGQSLPAPATAVVNRATEAALKAALAVALRTAPAAPSRFGFLQHRVAATASGAIGGAFGIASLPVELPVSTVLMLRAIADVAREAGEDLSDPDTAVACLQVFALGSRSGADDAAQSGYFAVRSLLSKTVAEAARIAAGRGLAEGGPAALRLVAQIASRFGIVMSQKVAAAALPILGAIGGGAVNAAFLEHFRAVASAHFTVRRLERAYGREPVRAAYETLRSEVEEREAARA